MPSGPSAVPLDYAVIPFCCIDYRRAPAAVNRFLDNVPTDPALINSRGLQDLIRSACRLYE